MGKLIIQNDSDLPDSEVLQYVACVVRAGRVSNNGKQYCYASRWPDGIVVCTSKNEKSDRLVVYREDT